MDILSFFKKSKFNSHYGLYQRIISWWIRLGLLDKILSYLFCASFFVIVIPSILNDFFYASIYFTDFSIGFAIVLLFLCVFWLGYFSTHTENSGFKELKDLKKLEKSKKFKKIVEKNMMSLFYLKFKNKFFQTEMFFRVSYGKLLISLQKKVSPKLILFLSIIYHSKKNIKVSGSDVNRYTQIKNMPSLLPLSLIGKNKIQSYCLIIKSSQKPLYPRRIEASEEK